MINKVLGAEDEDFFYIVLCTWSTSGSRGSGSGGGGGQMSGTVQCAGVMRPQPVVTEAEPWKLSVGEGRHTGV